VQCLRQKGEVVTGQRGAVYAVTGVVAFAAGLALTALALAGQTGAAVGDTAMFVAGSVAVVSFIGLYFLPSIVASNRKHHNIGAVVVVNVFLGWTFVGWVVALAMAASAVRSAALAAAQDG
jgi:hypothetical protein